MISYLIRRLILMIPTLIGITLLVFLLVALSPGGIGAALSAQGGTLQSQTSVALQQAYLEDRYGLDDPVIVQYVRWLGRISPVKLGRMDQVLPSGTRVRPPRAIKPPPLWPWYAQSLPQAPPATLELSASATPAERIGAYRQAEQAYAQARQAHIAAATNLREAVVRYAEAGELHTALTRDKRPRYALLRALGPDQSNPRLEDLRRLGAIALATYRSALAARANLVSAFDARPYSRPGLPVIPGVIGIDAPDLGTAYSRQRPVAELIKTHLPVTLLINLIAFPLIYLVAIPGGMLAASRRGKATDTLLGMLFVALWSVPTMLAGVLALGFLATGRKDGGLGLFPVSGLHDSMAGDFHFLPRWGAEGFQRGFVLDTLWHICLPVLCLVYTGFAVLSKQTRAAMLENFSADYVRTAKAKGVAPRDVLLRHVFRNSLLPLITMFVTIFPASLAGSVIVEKIFSIPGMGTLLLDAIAQRDRELILANTLIIAAVNITALLLADILYAIADPRVTYE